MDLHTPARPIAVASITATQPITQIPRIHFSIAEQRLNEDLSRESYAQRDQQLVNDVRRGYYSLLQSQSQAESQRAIIHSLEELDQLTERRLQEKAVLKADNLAVVLLISLVGIYLALLIQFNNAIKPLLVFAAAPYGAIGAMIALAVMHTPFGFMAFLGVASLIGVIVSHVIVLFDFIEEMHEKGEPLERALPDAGIERIRPVMITVGATILALFPLALEGGPLWKPLCYAQIGGLAVATFITLLLVPVFYAIFVLDLKWIKWEKTEDREETSKTEAAATMIDKPLSARNAP